MPAQEPAPSRNDGPRVNHQINVPNVRLVREDGSMVGVVTTREAISMAADAGLDLVEVSPNAEPPVCKILDLGKFKYEEQKSKNEARKKQKVVELKEIKLRPEHRQPRLRGEDARDPPLLRGRRQGEDHHALPRPRDGAPGSRHEGAATR